MKWNRLSNANGEVQGRYEELDGYGLESRAREVLAGSPSARR